MSDNFNFSGYYSGPVPDYAINLIGTGSVDASQVTSSFGKANEAISLVNQFDSSFLKNIAYIFNFDAGGAYGVYLPGLDRAIKTKELQRRLESEGYVIEKRGDSFIALPQDNRDISNEEIQRDIDKIYKEIDSRGGHVISVNTKKIISDAKIDAESLFPLVDGVWTKDQLWEKMSILHLGETIVHEATHAKGHSDEATPTAQQRRFVDWLWGKINSEFKSDAQSKGFDVKDNLPPLNSTRIARRNNWYKVSQSIVPHSFMREPTGSDLSGRMGQPIGDGNWGLMNHHHSTIPIESRLSREFMFELPEGVVQEHQIIDKQLQLQNKTLPKFKSSHSIEQRLEKDRGVINPYLIYEELLGEDRPRPIMQPIPLKTASAENRSLFGWYNNLELSDGNTLEGLSDRVMKWEDRDESFAAEEDWIRSQPRYNPKGYSLKGFWYVFVEPRFKPQLWDEMVQDNASVHPAKRFASKEEDCFEFAEKAIKYAIRKINGNDISCTRLIMTADFLEHLTPELKKIDNLIFEINHEGMDGFAVWIYNPDLISDLDIICVEDYFEDKGYVDRDLLEKVMGIGSSQFIGEILNKYCDLANEMGIHIIGSAARKIYMGDEDINFIEFSSEIPENCITFGNFICEDIGINSNFNDEHMILTARSHGIKLIFNGGKRYSELCSLLKYVGVDIKNPLILDIFNHIFTIDMISYNLGKREFIDYIGIDMEVVDIFLPMKFLLKFHEDIIERARYLKKRYNLRLSDEIIKQILNINKI